MANKANTDHELRLLKGCKRGKAEAQEGLYRHYYGYAMSICLRYAGSRDEASEILNDSFIKIFAKIKQFDFKKSFRAWLRRIIVNTAIDHYRKNKKHQYGLDISAAEGEMESENVLHQLAAEEIFKLIQQLPDKYRLAFNLYEIEGYSHEEIAEQLGVPIGTSRSNLSRAKRKLRELVSQHLDISYEKPLRRTGR
jgi:RNA polymerase sigma-70 factor (ECF subfamily)